MNDIDIIELNEAFLHKPLIREWGLKDDDPRINPNGNYCKWNKNLTNS